jgi:PAS domain S-box-containing protein
MSAGDHEGRVRELLRTVVENAPIVLFALDRQGVFTLSLGRGLQALGQEPGQVIGLSAVEMYRDTPWITGSIGRALAGEAFTVSGEVAGRWYETRYVPLLDAAGAFEGTIGVATDVTEQRLAEQRGADLLRREQAVRADAEHAHRRAAFLAEASRVLAGSLDYDVTLATVARLAIPELADWCVVDIVEKDGMLRRVVVVHPDPTKADLARALQARSPDPDAPEGIPRALRSGTPVVYQDVSDEQLRPDRAGGPLAGTRDPQYLDVIRRLGVRSYVVVPLVARERTLGALTFVWQGRARYTEEEIELADDLARRAALAVDNARLYQEAQSAVRLRQEFLSIASHELKTPMTSLRLAVQGLARGVEAGGPPGDRLPIMARTAERQARRLATLVGTLLDLTRIETDRLDLSREPFDLGEAARDVIDNLDEDLRRAGCVVTLSAPAAVRGRWDRSRIEQVITNLLDNAMKYGAGRPVEVAVYADGAAAILRIRDQGIGIEPERHADIFERFERAVSVQHYGGLGLGLYIVRRIVEAHDGRVRLRSAPGDGSTFTVELPLDAETLA